MMSETNGSSKVLLKLERIENVLRSVSVRLEEMDKKLDELLYEDDLPSHSVDNPKAVHTEFRDFVTDDDIRKNGQKIPYNKLMGGDQIAKFRSFLSHIRMNEDQYSEKEFEFAGFADKNFSDIRISDNSRRILGTAFQKTYKKPWEFRFMRGYMYKWQGQMAWEWEDGSLD